MTDYYPFFHQLLQLSRATVNKLNEKMAAKNLNHSQSMILFYLKNFGPSTLVDISCYLNVEKSSVTRTADRLEENGYIEQVPTKDKRERKIKLSDLGETAQASCLDSAKEFESVAMKEITQEELDMALQTLLKISENLK